MRVPRGMELCRLRSREEKETKIRPNKDSKGGTNEKAAGRREGKVGVHIPGKN